MEHKQQQCVLDASKRAPADPHENKKNERKKNLINVERCVYLGAK